MDDIVDLVRRSLADETYREFTGRVDTQATQLREAIADGRFDNEAFSVGLEIELYAINSVPEPPEPEDEEEEDEVEDPDADLMEGGDGGGDAWDGSLEPQGESGGGGASL
jgi:hypothetical protein